MIYLSPGVYTREIDLSQIVQISGASVGAMVFGSNKGPVVPRFIASDKQFIETYGEPDPQVSLAHYCALEFLREGGSGWFLRVTNGATYSVLEYDTSTNTFSNTSEADPTAHSFSSANKSFVVYPIGPGTYSSNLRLSITNAVVATTLAGLNGSGAVLTPVIGSNGQVTSVNIVNGGNNYVAGALTVAGSGNGAVITYGVNVTNPTVLTGVAGTGAVLAVNVTAGVITSVTILNGGSGYTAGSFTITGAGSSAAISYTVTSGVITGITITNGGTGYNSNLGPINTITVVNGGTGYADQPSFTVNVFDANNLNTPLESWNVSKQHQLDGYGKQMFLEDVINTYSSRIRVYNNAATTTNVSQNVTTAVAFSNASDGSAVGDSNLVTGWNTFLDQETYTVNILINGGYATTAVHNKMEAVASGRGDAFAILDMPSASQSVENALTYRKTTLNMNSSYAALYGPDYLYYDEFTDTQLYVPPSGAVSAVFCRTDTTRDPWWAPAGLNRGLVAGALGLRYKYLQGERDQLYSNQINYIQNFAGEGIAVFGQKTLQAKASALQSINVRRLLLVIEKAMANALKYSVFEPNDPFTRTYVTLMLNEFMTDVKNRRGVYEFKIVADETNNTPIVIDNNQLKVDVYIKPTRAAEYIQLNMVIMRTGASINETIASGVTA